MQGERILRAATLIARLRESGFRAHEYKIRTANKVCNIMQCFITEEVKRANSLPSKDPAYMSWDKVGKALNISRSAAFTRYGGKKD